MAACSLAAMCPGHVACIDALPVKHGICASTEGASADLIAISGPMLLAYPEAMAIFGRRDGFMVFSLGLSC